MQVTIDLRQKIKQFHGDDYVPMGNASGLMIQLAQRVVTNEMNADEVMEVIRDFAENNNAEPLTVGDVLLEGLMYIEADDKGKAKKKIKLDERKSKIRLIRKIEDNDILVCDDEQADRMLEYCNDRYGQHQAGQVIIVRITQIIEAAKARAEAKQEEEEEAARAKLRAAEDEDNEDDEERDSDNSEVA